LTTLEEPTSGAVKIFGVDVTERPQETKKMVGVVHQEVINSGFFTVNEILNFISGFYGRENNQERIDYLLNKLSLFEHRNKLVKQLSGGMKRRLMIAKALCHNPKILLLDEPTAGVDIQLREDLWKFVLELKKEGVTVLLTTHYLEEAEELCDRVGIINLGKLECVGPTQEIIHRFTQKEIVVVSKTPWKFESEYFLRQDPDGSYVFLTPPEVTLGDLFQTLQLELSNVVDVKIKEGTLEEAFVKVLGERNGSRL
ncbi:MAG: ABC transporter ATP-binding protein, partial [Bdellovibrionia bacterium]